MVIKFPKELPNGVYKAIFSHFKQHFKKMDLITIDPELDILLTEIRGSACSVLYPGKS